MPTFKKKSVFILFLKNRVLDKRTMALDKRTMSQLKVGIGIHPELTTAVITRPVRKKLITFLAGAFAGSCLARVAPPQRC